MKWGLRYDSLTVRMCVIVRRVYGRGGRRRGGRRRKGREEEGEKNQIGRKRKGKGKKGREEVNQVEKGMWDIKKDGGVEEKKDEQM